MKGKSGNAAARSLDKDFDKRALGRGDIQHLVAVWVALHCLVRVFNHKVKIIS